ncbi:MAG TPA: DNA recombination protein RmuC [Candidatus Poseidoniales archaeon]|nr:MAG TPA: DNA recombination protein RmuC [Candidatus Poseidoniales archaeon]HIH80934.1 DNA recombination protein RmuC [Candidatus Thalassarchaeaceae archaeon]|tara:strand:- start:36 stop:1247 length:1212 start_codon:yes stop_codon:yes gene_type:complete
MNELLSILFAALGLIIGWLAASQKSKTEIIRAEERLAAVEHGREALTAQMESVATQVSRQNSEDFLKLAEERLGKVSAEAEKDHEARRKEIEALLGPMTTSLEGLEKFSKDLEKERIDAYAGIKRQIQTLGDRADKLGTEASNLSTALRKSSSVRGDWGEVALRNLLEMAGMTKHTDFLEQKGAGGLIPDMVVRLPGNGAIPIDAKTSGKHYLEALEFEEGDARQAKLVQHAKAMRERVTDLSRKDYLSKVSGRADFVVMFVPSEALISVAFEVDPALHADAMNRGVVITSPASMIALLRTAALYWQQVRFAEEAKDVVEVAREFYKRMAVWSEHFAEVGKRLDKATEFYNKAVGSWEKNVLPQGRLLENLEVATNLPKGLTEPKEVGASPREPAVIDSTEEE